MNEIRGLRKDFSHQSNEPIVTWLLQCCDNGANSVWLDSREARQLGGITRNSAIDRDISTCQNQAFTLWKPMLVAIKERYPFKDDLMPQKKKWTSMEKGIHYLREYAVVEMLHSPTFIPVVVGVLRGYGMYGTGLSLSIERQCYSADLDAEKTGEEEG